MMDPIIPILSSVTIVSLIAFIGIIFIGLKEKALKRILTALVGFASGTLLGDAFLHLIPEAILESPSNPDEAIMPFYYVILGIVAFFALEKFLYWRHCHEETCPAHMFVYLNLLGDGIHNFIDGMIISATFIVNFELGFATTLAVVFHEIPQEIGDFGILVYGGLSRKKALTYNFVSAVTAVLGALVTYFLTTVQDLQTLLVPFAAGGFIYIAATDLMPELHKKYQAPTSLIQLITILLGIALMAYIRVISG
ncbi:MAG: ZIP family metal transporter [Candidatus Bathyarchaeia archaeon]